MHAERARAYRDELENLLPATKIRALKQKADATHNAEWPRLHKLRLFKLWVGIHIGIASFGVVLSLIALFFPIAA